MEHTEAVAAASTTAGIAKQKPSLALMSKNDILATDKREYREIDVSKWWKGKKVRVQSLTAGERDEWEASYVKERKDGKKSISTRQVRAGLVGRCLVDANDDRLFSDEEIGALQDKHAGAVDAIFSVCAEMNGITEQDVEEIKGN